MKHEASDARAGSAIGVNHPTERSGSASMLIVGTGPLARVIVTVSEGQRRSAKVIEGRRCVGDQTPAKVVEGRRCVGDRTHLARVIV